MQIRIFIVLLIVCAISTILQNSKFGNITKIKLNAESESLNMADKGKLEDKPKIQVNQAEKSGPVSVLPWENDNKFKTSIEQNGGLIKIVAYHTVLKDPLPGEEYNVHLGASLLCGTIIKPGAVFSQNNTVGPYDENKGFRKGPTYIGTSLTTTIGGGVCKIASTLYNVTILSNLEIVERHFHGMPVPYVPYGQDATVAYGAKDFKFKNNTSDDLMIWSQGIDNVLYIAFYGKSKPPNVQWHHEVLGNQTAPRLFRSNPLLPKGTEKVLVEGMDGLTVRSWITIKNTNGVETVKQLGVSHYKPMPYVVEKGTQEAAVR